MNCAPRKKSTMGFTPNTQHKPSFWLTPEGNERFLKIIQEKVDAQVGEPIVIHDTKELLEALINTIMVRGETELIVNEVIEHCILIVLGRLNLFERLTSIREDMIRLEPRGCYGREKGCLPMKDVKGVTNGSMYEQFLKSQQGFRTL